MFGKYEGEKNPVFVPQRDRRPHRGFLRSDVRRLPLQGVRAVIAESFERLHKKQLVGVGILPLRFAPEQNADTLELAGTERFSVSLPQRLAPGQQLDVKAGHDDDSHAPVTNFSGQCRFRFFFLWRTDSMAHGTDQPQIKIKELYESLNVFWMAIENTSLLFFRFLSNFLLELAQYGLSGNSELLQKKKKYEMPNILALF